MKLSHLFEVSRDEAIQQQLDKLVRTYKKPTDQEKQESDRRREQFKQNYAAAKKAVKQNDNVEDLQNNLNSMIDQYGDAGKRATIDRMAEIQRSEKLKKWQSSDEYKRRVHNQRIRDLENEKKAKSHLPYSQLMQDHGDKFTRRGKKPGSGKVTHTIEFPAEINNKVSDAALIQFADGGQSNFGGRVRRNKVNDDTIIAIVDVHTD